MQTLGEKLKLAREKRKLTASQAAAATRMKVQHVIALEANDFGKFAAAAYAKGFIKLYAEFLGLDPAPLIREYTERFMPKQRQKIMPEESRAQAQPPHEPSPPSQTATEPGKSPSVSAPEANMEAWLKTIASKGSAWLGTFAVAGRRIPWRRVAAGTAGILVLLAITRVARCSGQAPGSQAKTPHARASASMSMIIADPPEPYLPSKADQP